MSIQDILAGLQKTYLASMPERLSLIDSHFKSNDLEKLETEYHKLKGSGLTYGLPEFSQLGALLERVCKIAPQDLPKAVPLSLALFAKMRDARTQASQINLNDEPDYKAIVKIVEAAGPTP